MFLYLRLESRNGQSNNTKHGNRRKIKIKFSLSVSTVFDENTSNHIINCIQLSHDGHPLNLGSEQCTKYAKLCVVIAEFHIVLLILGGKMGGNCYKPESA